MSTDEVLQPDYLILPIDARHRSGSFRSGGAEFNALKVFLRNEAVKFKEGFIAQTYIIVDDNERIDKQNLVTEFEYKILGYITLTCSEVAIEGYRLKGCESAERYASLPAVKIARLAVDCRMQGKSLGRQLFEYALMVAKDEIMPRVGCRFLITDAKKAAVSFYKKQEMQMLDTEENRAKEHPIMFIDLCDDNL